jgi:hypothetical protein
VAIIAALMIGGCGPLMHFRKGVGVEDGGAGDRRSACPITTQRGGQPWWTASAWKGKAPSPCAEDSELFGYNVRSQSVSLVLARVASTELPTAGPNDFLHSPDVLTALSFYRGKRHRDV